MDKFLAFTTTICRAQIEGLDLNKINQEIFKYQEECDVSALKSNRGGWQSLSMDYSPSMGQKIIPSMDIIIEKCLPFIRESFLDYGLAQKEYWIYYWLNVNRKYNYNIAHAHGDAKMSAVLYTKVPKDSGNIEFLRSVDLIHTFDIKNENNFGSFYIEPREGNLIIFPSQLRHHVFQNLTNDDDDRRVSIAFNIS
jgi:uncharacterized protein (TIGR02466 family)